jgi:hypothetical protein
MTLADQFEATGDYPMRNLIDHLQAAGFQTVETSDPEGVVMLTPAVHVPLKHTAPMSNRKVKIESDTLDALRADYDTLRRFVVSLAEGYQPLNVSGAAVEALQQCSATYLPKGHPDRSH